MHLKGNQKLVDPLCYYMATGVSPGLVTHLDTILAPAAWKGKPLRVNQLGGVVSSGSCDQGPIGREHASVSPTGRPVVGLYLRVFPPEETTLGRPF